MYNSKWNNSYNRTCIFDKAVNAWEALLHKRKINNRISLITSISYDAYISYIALQSLNDLSHEEKVILYSSLINFNFPTRNNLNIEQTVREEVFKNILQKKKLRLYFTNHDNPTESEWEQLTQAMIIDNDITNAKRLVKRINNPIPDNVKDQLEALIVANKLI